MALRSLAGRIGARLVRWATRGAPPPPPPPAVAAELDMALKSMKPGSFEAQALAFRKNLIEKQRISDLEFEQRIRKKYRDIRIMGAACVGLIIFYWSRAEVAFAEALAAKWAAEENEGANVVNATKEEGKTMDAKEEGKTMDAKEEGKMADAKEEGKTTDEEQV